MDHTSMPIYHQPYQSTFSTEPILPEFFSPPRVHSGRPSIPVPANAPKTRIEERARRAQRRRENYQMIRQRKEEISRFRENKSCTLVQQLLHWNLMRESARHKKELHMERKLERAKTALIHPKHFQIIDINTDDDNIVDYQANTTDNQIITMHDSENDAATKATKSTTFVGTVVIQDCFNASYAYYEQRGTNPPLATSGHHSFYVDAAVSPEAGMTGITVAHKGDQRDGDSQWVAKGYRIHQMLDQEDAGVWAISQALQNTLQIARADQAITYLPNRCSTAAIHSDCKPALERIGNRGLEDGKAVRRVIAQSMELRRLKVDVRLQWISGQKGVLRNELADIVAEAVRKPLHEDGAESLSHSLHALALDPYENSHMKF